MFLKFLMDKPMLGLGILMFVTVALSAGGVINLGLFTKRPAPTSCRAALVRLERQIPANWAVACADNNLNVVINELQVPADAKDLRPVMYRQLANYLVTLTKLSQIDILEKVYIIHLKLIHPKIEINAISEGKYVAKLATITKPEFIRDHLKQTVQVKETLK